MKFFIRYSFLFLAFLGAGVLFCLLSIWGEAELSKTSTIPERRAPTSERLPGTLRVASLNCKNYLSTNRYTSDDRYKRYWAKPYYERAALWKLIGQVQPDVLALQEIGGEKQLAQLVRDLEREQGLVFPYLTYLDGRDEKRKIAFISRLPFERILKFEETEFMSRGLLGVELRQGELKMTIFTLHLKSKLERSKEDPECNAERLAEARRVRKILEQTGTEHFVLLGDFNDSRESLPVRVFADWERCLRADLQDSFGRRWTYRNFSAEYEHTFDHCFISKALMAQYVPESGKIADEGIACLHVENRLVYASDHRMIFADFACAHKKREPRDEVP